MVRKYPAPLSIIMRWGHLLTPSWVLGTVTSNPPANSAIVSYSVPAGRVGYIYGFYIAAPAATDFRLEWTSGGTVRSYFIMFNSKGTMYFADIIPMNEGLPADPGSSIAIRNIQAGTGEYHAGLFVGVM